jgi:hypothetical protein
LQGFAQSWAGDADLRSKVTLAGQITVDSKTPAQDRIEESLLGDLGGLLDGLPFVHGAPNW